MIQRRGYAVSEISISFTGIHSRPESRDACQGDPEGWRHKFRMRDEVVIQEDRPTYWRVYIQRNDPPMSRYCVSYWRDKELAMVQVNELKEKYKFEVIEK